MGFCCARVARTAARTGLGGERLSPRRSCHSTSGWRNVFVCGEGGGGREGNNTGKNTGVQGRCQTALGARRWCSRPPQQWAFGRLAAAATRPRACRDPPNAGYKRECSREGETTWQKNETRNGAAMHGGGAPAAPTLYMHRGGSRRNSGGALKPLLRAGTTARWHPGRSARGRRLSAPAAPRAGWWAAAGLAAA
jgi:hypothetical protein